MTFATRRLIKLRPEPGAIGLEEIALPPPLPDEVVVKVRYAAICGTDLHLYAWNDWAMRRYHPPFPLGHEFSGEVVEIGRDVAGFRPGDRVTAETHFSCGRCRQCRLNRRHTCLNLKVFSRLGRGCFSDYTIAPEQLLRRAPDGVSLRAAAVMEPLGISVRAVLDAQPHGANMLIVGCGPIGLFAIAAARAFGAARIVASDPSPLRRSLAQDIGADAVFDPNGDSMPSRINEITHGEGVEIALDASGNPDAIRQALDCLSPGGALSIVSLPSQEISLDIAQHVVLREIAIRGFYGRLIDETWLQVERLLSRGVVPIDRIVTHDFALDDHRNAFEAALGGGSGKVMFTL